MIKTALHIKTYRFFLLVVCSFFPFLVDAQTTGKIAGTITDQNGEPLPGVNVRLVDTDQGNATNVNGEYFILNIKPGTYTLLVSYWFQNHTHV